MTEWIDFSVYAAMTIVCWFGFPGWASALALQMVADRNEDWLTANRERARTLLGSRWLVGSRWFRWSCYAWGAISLAVLLAVLVNLRPQFLSMAAHTSPTWALLKEAHSTLLILGLLWYLAVVVASTRQVAKIVPLPERRQATLTPRTINDFVPRWFRTATYVLTGVHLAGWVIVGALGMYATPGFWVRLAGPVSFSGIFLLIAHAMVYRRWSDCVMLHDRRLGVRFAFGSLIYTQLMFAMRLYGEIAGPSFDLERITHLALVFMLVVGMLVLAFVQKNDPRGLTSLRLGYGGPP
jgi:hypothetical protein